MTAPNLKNSAGCLTLEPAAGQNITIVIMSGDIKKQIAKKLRQKTTRLTAP